ncbi:MAG: hypothetical protein SFT93_04905 [Rickettsiaceae bacterium]|nr:hypothetical protein [Rickettsiaceae bacterium]
MNLLKLIECSLYLLTLPSDKNCVKINRSKFRSTKLSVSKDDLFDDFTFAEKLKPNNKEIHFRNLYSVARNDPDQLAYSSIKNNEQNIKETLFTNECLLELARYIKDSTNTAMLGPCSVHATRLVAEKNNILHKYNLIQYKPSQEIENSEICKSENLLSIKISGGYDETSE